MAVKCLKCHSENPDTKPFCGDCGAQLIPPEKPQVSETLTLDAHPEGLPGRALFAGRFELIEELGAGGMGQVYRAFDKEVGEEIALKVLRPEIALGEDAVERFRNEIKLARRITHKNVCRMHELHQDGKRLFITMEYVSGQNLKGLFKETGALSTGKAVSIAKQVAKGLAEAHDLGVIHRDLKPHNIMVDTEGNAKIMDFGIARSLRTSGMTAEGMIIGTPEYMAPEQVEGLDADQRTDIYALGAILFEMVTGRVPFQGDTPLSVAYQHKNKAPLAPRKLNPQIPESLDQLILRCLEKEKKDRCRTADELLADLVRIEDGLPVSERVILKARPTVQIAREKATGLRRFRVPVVVFLGLMFAAALIWRFGVRKTAIYPPPIENSIAVITFENQTGDPAYDFFRKCIPNLLITSLENSGLFGFVATRERMQDLLKQAGKKDIEFSDADSGFEACRREGIQAIALGSFVRAGDTFVTDVKIRDVKTNRLLASASSKGAGEDSILRAQIDELTRKIAEAMGIADRQIAASQRSIVDVTTNSTEAYKLYLKGLEEDDQHAYESAARCFERAVEVDPSFAMAYAALSEVYTQLINSKAVYATLEKAGLHSDRATEKERLYIDAHRTYAVLKDHAGYLRKIEELIEKYPREKRFLHELAIFVKDNNPARAIGLYKRAQMLDPDWTLPINNLALIYGNIGEYEESLQTLKKLALLTPEDPNVYESMGHALFQMGKIDDAIDSFKKALAIEPAFAWSLSSIAYSYAFKEDYEQALARLAAMAPLQPEYFQDQIKYCEAILSAEISMAEGLPEKAVDTMKKAKARVVRYINYPEYHVRFNLPAQKDVLAWAYVAAGDLHRAIAEYERMATFDPQERSSFLIYPQFNHRLARLYEEKGLTVKARARYSRFLELWKNADPGLPEVEDAQNRLAALE